MSEPKGEKHACAGRVANSRGVIRGCVNTGRYEDGDKWWCGIHRRSGSIQALKETALANWKAEDDARIQRERRLKETADEVIAAALAWEDDLDPAHGYDSQKAEQRLRAAVAFYRVVRQEGVQP